MSFKWSEQEEEMLKTICESGGSKDEAVQILGRTIHAIEAKTKYLDLRFTAGHPELDMDAYKKYLKQKGLK